MSSAATKNSWKCKSLEFPTEMLDYYLFLSNDLYQDVRMGYIPMDQDDKWFIYCESDVLYLVRSWTGDVIFKCRIVDSEDGQEIISVEVNRDPLVYSVSNASENLNLLAEVMECHFKIIE